MADINYCKKLLEYRATKSGFNGNLSPNDFNTIWQSAEQRHFNTEYIKYGINKSNVDSLVPFKSDPTTITVDALGKYTKPSTLLHVDAIRTTLQKPMKEVFDDRLGAHLDSTYDAPTVLSPIYTEYAAYIQFNPINIGQATLVFLNKLIPAVWGYTLVNGRPVYNPATSVQPLWGVEDLDKIIYLMGIDLGLNMRDQLEIQMSDKLAKETV